jgi:glutathione S-transferase
MELHDNPFSPYACKVRTTLYEKGIQHDQCVVKTKADRDRLLAINPRGEVPALVDGTTVISDSKVICAYLEERYPTPALIPSAPSERARCRGLELKADTDVDAAVIVLATVAFFRPELLESHPDALPAAKQVVRDHYAFFERELKGQDWLLEEFSLADIALIPHVAAASYFGCALDDFPSLAAWLARASERPAVGRALGELVEAAATATEVEDSLFDPQHLHWRNDRIEALMRCGLGPWLMEEFAAGRAFLSPTAPA